MPKLKISSSALAPEGKHQVELEEVKEVQNSFYKPEEDSPDRATQFEWIFTLVADPSIRIRAWSSVKLSTHKGIPSKALTIVEALVGKKLDGKERDEFSDTDTLLGKQCIVEVEHTTNRTGDVRTKIVDFQTDNSSEETEGSKKVPF
jgi:hypothetical protein